MEKILQRIHSPEDLRKLTGKELTALPEEIRKRIIDVVSKNGGHLAPNLGTVELTIALHMVFHAPEEPLDVKELPIDMETFQAHDIKPQVKFPYTFREIFPWVAGALAIIGLVVLLVYWIRHHRKARQEEEKAEPAHIRALRKLDKFRSDKFWRPENQKTFYSGVTDALREYIASRYGVGAMEMTTAEIFEDLKGSDIPEDLYAEMKALFERADFVKFAKFTASDEENAQVLPQAVRFVTATYQAQLEEENSEKKEE